MVSPQGRKIFFINPPESLKNEFLEYIFKNEFELYLLESTTKVEQLLDIFKDSILFINIDKEKSKTEWMEYIQKINSEYKDIVITLFSKSVSQAQQKYYLMEVGIKGGFIQIDQDNWKAIEIINRVLEINEARGRRKSVRLDFGEHESRGDLQVQIYTTNGYSLHGGIESISSAGLLVSTCKRKISGDDNVDEVVFTLSNNQIRVKGHLLKRFENGNYFISFEEIESNDKEFVQSFIFQSLQNSFKELLNKI